MKKFEIFETVVQIIQSSFDDGVILDIHQNYYIDNIDGRPREIDVFIECEINTFTLQIAIECKDYANPVSVEKLEAFHGKCLRIPTINKKVFVTKKGYQADAILAAKNFGIDLYTLEELSEKEVRSWLGIDVPRPVYIQRIVTGVGLGFNEPNEIVVYENDILQINGAKISILEFVKIAVNNKICE